MHPQGQVLGTGDISVVLDVRRGVHPGRTSADQVSLFVTTGSQGLQFASVAGRVLKFAREQGLGQPFPADWFLENIRN